MLKTYERKSKSVELEERKIRLPQQVTSNYELSSLYMLQYWSCMSISKSQLDLIWGIKFSTSFYILLCFLRQKTYQLPSVIYVSFIFKHIVYLHWKFELSLQISLQMLSLIVCLAWIFCLKITCSVFGKCRGWNLKWENRNCRGCNSFHCSV